MIVIFIINLFIQTIFVSLIHHYQLNRYQLYFFFSVIFLLSVKYEYNIFKMNIFISLFLVIIILLTKLTCFKKFFISYISPSSTFLHFNLNAYIVFHSFRIILLLNTSEVSFFIKGLGFFLILGIIALNFLKTNVEKKTFFFFKKRKCFGYFNIHFLLLFL